MTTLPKKTYFRLSELAEAWDCSVEDIHHLFLHGQIKVGICFHDELLYGVNAELQTVGAYLVTGVLTIPEVLAADWEFDAAGIADAGGFKPERGYPPNIEPAGSVLAEPSESWAFWKWAPGRDWNHPETDHQQIESFQVGVRGIDADDNPIFDWRGIDPNRLVIHATERARIEKSKSPAQSDRAETTDLHIIGALLGLMLGKTPAGKAQSVYHSQAAIIDALLFAYPGKAGIAESTLKARFAEAKKRLAQS